jgi:hypothetical protein
MLKRLPHQTFSVFIVLYFVLKESFFTSKILSGRNMEGSITSDPSSALDLWSFQLGETQWNEGLKGRGYLLPSSSLSSDYLLKFI